MNDFLEIGKVIIFVGLGIGCLFLGAVFTVIASKKLVKKQNNKCVWKQEFLV